MLRCNISVDLPSVETERHKGPIEWVRSLFGAQIDLRSGKEDITIGAFALVEALVGACADAGVDDAISFLVDKKVIYADPNDVPSDLPLIVIAAQNAGVFNRKFNEMHLVLAYKTQTLHTIIDCTITNHVMLGEAELKVMLSSRVCSMQVGAGETAQQYADRVRGFAKTEGGFEPFRQEQDQLGQRLVHALRRRFTGSSVTCDGASVQLLRPSAQQIGRFRRLQFGDGVRAPMYRAVPTTQRSGAYHDPFYYYYYDPYYDFANYMMVDAMLHDSAWHSPHVHVCNTDGTEVCNGAEMPEQAGALEAAWTGHDAVCFADDGALQIDDACPDTGSVDSSSDSDAAWSDDASSSDAGDSSWTDSSSSDSSASSGSSCGSSCSSTSSCGSSCGSSSD
jgi:hypothetical protein